MTEDLNPTRLLISCDLAMTRSEVGDVMQDLIDRLRQRLDYLGFDPEVSLIRCEIS